MRRFVLLAAVGAVAAATIGAASATPPTPDNPAGHTLGIVPAHGAPAAKAAATRSGGSNLSYHGGPVEHGNTVYALYWDPTGGSATYGTGYETAINQYFTDVSTATLASATSNVYYAATQYTDGSGHVGIGTTFGGSASSNDKVTGGCSESGMTICVTDAQIASEVQTAAAAHGWRTGPNAEIFVFTPKNVGSCSGSQCSFTYYCAYHSWTGSGSGVVLYANMPYADTNPSACGTGQHPNGNDADDTLNVTSHEHNETLTDEQGNAWFDSRGYENGDKCAWTFGSALGGSPGSEYNQVINGHYYYLQREWSNATSRCVLTGT